MKLSPSFAELEMYLLACMVLYLDLLVLSAYAGLANSRRRIASRAALGEAGRRRR